MGDISGDAGVVRDTERGMAMRMAVRVVRRGMEAERRARRAVCRRWGRIVRDCFAISLNVASQNEGRGFWRTLFTPVASSSSGRLRICSVSCTRVRGMRRVRIMLLSVLWTRVSRWRSLGPGVLVRLLIHRQKG